MNQIAPDTRTESDFVQHIRRIIESDPQAIKWHLIMDCLNTHQSESLVRFVAEKESLNIDLGIKGKTGILKSIKSRAAWGHCARSGFLYVKEFSSA